jgi:hypothetical protein
MSANEGGPAAKLPVRLRWPTILIVDDGKLGAINGTIGATPSGC